jgi:hypothetical protein
MEVQRTLQFGSYALPAAPGDSVAPYVLSSQKLYVIGTTDGTIQPVGAEHLVGEMGGVWAHPVKVADGLTVQLVENGTLLPAPEHLSLTEALSHVEWRYNVGGLVVRRRDFVPDATSAVMLLVTLENTTAHRRTGLIQFNAWLKFLGCWFGGLHSGGGEYWRAGDMVLGHARSGPGQWGVACGTGQPPTRCEYTAAGTATIATLSYTFALEPGQHTSWEFGLAAATTGGDAAARQMLGQLLGRGEELLAEKIARYAACAFGGVVLTSPDQEVDRAFALAKANLELLSADYSPGMPPFFLAGVPEYPQLFGCDTEYTVPGATAAGFAEQCKSALLGLASYAERACGRVPHEITTNGRVFHPGNTQETPQFAAACWDYARWTGDLAFLQQVYPLCREGVDQYLPMLWGSGRALYPIGDGVVERPGMGSRKLDSTCYLFQALGALADMAAALEQPAEAAHYRERQVALGTHFERDWWLDAEGMYADSLHTDLTAQLDGHWTVVLPLQLGMAADARARRALARIADEWVNEWGLVHTRGHENAVWTLPTGLLALTAFRYGQPELGMRLLLNIAETTMHGMLGAFKELIPIGLCFVQLWSAGLYVQGIIEGLFGLQPQAHRHELRVAPCLPTSWPAARLANLLVGAHCVDVQLRSDGIQLAHTYGPAPLRLVYRVPGGVVQLAGAATAAALNDGWLAVEVPSENKIDIHIDAHQALLSLSAL